MSATPDDVAATTEDVPSKPDGDAEAPKGAESAPAVVSDTDEVNRATTSGVGKRIDELTRNWRETERDRDYWREVALRNAAYERERQERPEPQQPQAKSLEDFGGDTTQFAAYLMSEVDRRAEQRLKEIEDRQRRESEVARRDDFKSYAQEYAEKNKISDFEIAFREPKDGGPTISEHMAETIIESEHGPAIAYYLAKNPDIASKIANLPPLQQARELGRIEVRLAEKPKTPVVSEAPPPAPRLSGSGDPQTGVKPDTSDSDSLSDAEWARRRKLQLERRRTQKA